MTSNPPKVGDKVRILSDPYCVPLAGSVYIKSIFDTGSAFLTNVESLEVEDHEGYDDRWCLFFRHGEFEVIGDQNG